MEHFRGGGGGTFYSQESNFGGHQTTELEDRSLPRVVSIFLVESMHTLYSMVLRIFYTVAWHFSEQERGKMRAMSKMFASISRVLSVMPSKKIFIIPLHYFPFILTVLFNEQF